MKRCYLLLALIFVILSSPILASEDSQVVTVKVTDKVKCKWDGEIFYKVYYQIDDYTYVSYIDEFCNAVKKNDIIQLTECSGKDNIVDCFVYLEGDQKIHIPIKQVDWKFYQTRHMGNFMIVFGAIGFILSIAMFIYNVRYL